jgi:hypothetical protein
MLDVERFDERTGKISEVEFLEDFCRWRRLLLHEG